MMCFSIANYLAISFLYVLIQLNNQHDLKNNYHIKGMQSAINSPQSKSVTIVFIALKTTIFMLIITNTAKSMAHDNQQSFLINEATKQCTSKMLNFASIVQIFNLLGCILDIFCLVYFFCQNEFRCMEYYVFYAYHIVLLLVSVIGALTTRGGNDSCEFEKEFLTSVLAGSLIFFVSSLIIMASTLYFSLKYAHFGSNLVWFIIWMMGGECQSPLVMLVALIHGMLSLTGMALFLLNKVLKKTSLTAKIWRAFTFVSLIAMLFCYVVVLFGLLAGKSCESAQFFKKSYELYGLLEIISPGLILIFLKSEEGDPRQKIIKNHDEVFEKLTQNENINLKQVQ